MFYYLRGFASPIDTISVSLDVSGVGYLLTVSSYTMGEIMKNGDKEVMLYTYMAIREDAAELYGFFDTTELGIFKLLITVSGIGPKVALSLLSTLTPGELAAAIAGDDKRAIATANGIGAKTAARIVLELKDKIRSIDAYQDKNVNDTGEDSVGESVGEKLNDVADSLSSLGYTRNEISAVMSKIDRNGEIEQMIKQALKLLMR